MTVFIANQKARMSLYLSVNDKLSVMTSFMKCPPDGLLLTACKYICIIDASNGVNWCFGMKVVLPYATVTSACYALTELDDIGIVLGIILHCKPTKTE